jgi:hypothetical protein
MIPSKIWYFHLQKKNKIIVEDIDFCESFYEIISKEISAVKETIQKEIVLPEYLIKGTTLIKWFDETFPEAVVPDGVTSIGDEAFSRKIHRSIKLPDSVTFIGDKAFSYCENLETINIPDGVTYIGAGAFYGCENLVSVYLPVGCTYIAKSTFWAREKLRKNNYYFFLPNFTSLLYHGTLEKLFLFIFQSSNS